MTPQEKEKLDALAEFAAGVGHEFNNPLAIISGHAQILLSEIDHPAHRRHLGVILAQVKRAYEMIADIRFFARPPQPQPTLVQLSSWFSRYLSEWKDDYPAVDLRYSFEPAVSVSVPERQVRVDAAMLGTVLTALLKNAAEALVSVPNPMVWLSVTLSDSSLSFTIEDNGSGVAKDQVRYLFDPYYSGRSAGRGLGFGLPKSYALVQAMGGTISVCPSGAIDSPTERTGLRVEVEIPA